MAHLTSTGDSDIEAVTVTATGTVKQGRTRLKTLALKSAGSGSPQIVLKDSSTPVFWLHSPNGKVRKYTHLRQDTSTGYWNAFIPLTKYAEAGTWKPYLLVVKDKAGNETRENFNQPSAINLTGNLIVPSANEQDTNGPEIEHIDISYFNRRINKIIIIN
mgnify:CR=1 FL=1